jgi:hypothetical protein
MGGWEESSRNATKWVLLVIGFVKYYIYTAKGGGYFHSATG